jgi:hypothetical protein
VAEIRPIHTAKPDPDVIEMCEQLLAEAKEGRIQGLAVATVEADRTFGTAFEVGGGAVLSLIGAVTLLQHDLAMTGFEHD